MQMLKRSTGIDHIFWKNGAAGHARAIKYEGNENIFIYFILANSWLKLCDSITFGTKEPDCCKESPGVELTLMHANEISLIVLLAVAMEFSPSA